MPITVVFGHVYYKVIKTKNISNGFKFCLHSTINYKILILVKKDTKTSFSNILMMKYFEIQLSLYVPITVYFILGINNLLLIFKVLANK